MPINMRWSLSGIAKHNPNLFAQLVLPEGVNKQDFIDTLLLEYGQFGLATPIEQFPAAVSIWCKRNQYTISGLYKTTMLQYNPIENYDRFEEYKDTAKGNGTHNTTAKHTGGTSAKSDSTTTDKSAGYPSETLKVDGEGKTIGNSTVTNDLTDAITGGSTNSSTVEHTAHLHGNIGVTTTQEMGESERSFVLFDFYKTIANLFATELLIGIWL